MEKVEVTDEMRLRVLKNINNLDIKEHLNKPAIRFLNKKFLPIAACVMIMVALPLAYILQRNTTNPIPPQTHLENEIIEVDSLDELSNMVGFEVQELSVDDYKVKYTSYWRKMAQITYISEIQTIIFRQSLGIEDNSGDYTEYEIVEQQNIEGIEVTLKGHEIDKIKVASWCKGDMSFSINISKGISLEEYERLIYNFISK